MRSGHVIYKVANLDEAVKEWRGKGFVVEYGKKKNPINALIYFSEGPYIELLESTGMPKALFKIAKIFDKFSRFRYLETCKTGWCDFCIEKDFADLSKEIEYLNSHGIEGFYLKKGRRKDIHDRILKYKCFFPNDLEFPFLMSYFDKDPKPQNFVHPNGKKKITLIRYYISDTYYDTLKKLVDAEELEIIKDDQKSGKFEIYIDGNKEN